MWAIIERALDLASAFVDFLISSSVSVPVLQFGGIILVAFLLGLLLGRITKRRVDKAGEHAEEGAADRISLDFERLTPLGPSEKEAAEHSAMDISDLRTDRMGQERATSILEEQQEPTLLKE